MRATSTALITAGSDSGPRGFLALSATHLCATPPLMMVSVDKKTSALLTIKEAGHFAINFLSTEQSEVLDMFVGKDAPKGAARFHQSHWTTLATGAPILLNAAGVIDCEVEETIERYDTVIVIGRLQDYIIQQGVSSMISYRGQYRPLEG